MSADDQPFDPSRHRRSASLPMPGRARRWPVRRLDLKLFLSTDAREHRQRQGLTRPLEPNEATRKKEMHDEESEPEATGGQAA